MNNTEGHHFHSMNIAISLFEKRLRSIQLQAEKVTPTVRDHPNQ